MKNIENRRQADVGHRVARVRPSAGSDSVPQHPRSDPIRASKTEPKISPRENPATAKMRSAGSTDSELDKL